MYSKHQRRSFKIDRKSKSRKIYKCSQFFSLISKYKKLVFNKIFNFIKNKSPTPQKNRNGS